MDKVLVDGDGGLLHKCTVVCGPRLPGRPGADTSGAIPDYADSNFVVLILILLILNTVGDYIAAQIPEAAEAIRRTRYVAVVKRRSEPSGTLARG